MEKVKAPGVDRRSRFLRTGSRRLRELDQLSILVQALALRPRNYQASRVDIAEMFRAWRQQLDLVYKIFTQTEESVDTSASVSALSKGEFDFSSDAISPENETFHRVAASRIRRILLGLYKITALFGKNYDATSAELKGLLEVLESQYRSTLNELEPGSLTTNCIATWAPKTYSMMSLNCNLKSGTTQYSHANLMIDVWPALTGGGHQLPDILLLNEVTSREGDFEEFVGVLEEAGYRVFRDTRSVKNANEVLIAVGPRLILNSSKVEVMFPGEDSGLDAMGVVFKYFDGSMIGVVASRLHSAEATKDMRVAYRSIGKVALPQLVNFIKEIKKSFPGVHLLGGGDFNHGMIRKNYEGLAQKPAKFEKMASDFLEVGLNMTTPSGFSNNVSHTSIDHLFSSVDCSLEKYNYLEMASSNLDHKAVVGDVMIPFVSTDTYYESLLEETSAHKG